MKILFHLNSMGHGGAERVVSILSNAFVQHGHEVIITTEWESEHEYLLDQRVRRIHVGLSERENSKNRGAKIWLRYVKIRKCIQMQKPDLVISFCNKANFRSAVAMLGMKIPLLISVRNDPQKDYAPYKMLTQYMERKAAGCVFQTPDAARFFSERLQNKSRVIFNPVSENFLKIEENSAHLIARKKEIVTVGRISRQKNQMLLLCAFQNIWQKHPEYSLKIYGEVQEKDFYDEMQKYIDEKGLRRNVFFMGISDKLAKEIQVASVFVLPSDYEGMPNALIEAMVLGLPCIATDCPCGGSALLIQDQISGRLVPTGEIEPLQRALEDMLEYPERAELMGKNAKKVLEKVHPDKICNEWMKYIFELLEKG